MTTNRLLALAARGQSVWQDNITRGQLVSGSLKQLVEVDGLSGVTSNPTIFQKAIADSSDYQDAIAHLSAAGNDAAEGTSQRLAVKSLAAAAAVTLAWFDWTPPHVIRVSAPSLSAAAATSCILRTLFPPNANPIASSRFTSRRAPLPIASRSRGSSSTGVG